MRARTQKHFVCPTPAEKEKERNLLVRWFRRKITEPVSRTAHAIGRSALAPERFM